MTTPENLDREDLAAELLAELAAGGGDLDLTGFTRAETDALLRRLVHRERTRTRCQRYRRGSPARGSGRCMSSVRIG